MPIPHDLNPLPEELPYKYRLKYIESDGSQWIDTGLTSNDSYNLNLIWEQKACYTKSNGAEGLNKSPRYYFMGVYNNRYYYGLGNPASSIIYTDNKFHIFELNQKDKVFKIDTETQFKGNGVSSPNNDRIYLFNCNNYSTHIGGKKEWCRFINGNTGELVRDYIPVLDKNGRPCLFDKVQKKFYYNQGSGEFSFA